MALSTSGRIALGLLAIQAAFLSSCTKDAAISPGLTPVVSASADPIYLVSTVATQLHNPQAVAADGSGNLYVTELSGPAVIMFSPQGQKIPLAGIQSVATQPGAPWSMPEGIAVDAAGQLFVADPGSDALFKIILPEGPSSLQVQAIQASKPFGLGQDPDGSIFVTDANSSLIRKLLPSGQLMVFAESSSAETSGLASNGSLDPDPRGIVADKNGNIYTTDALAGLILKINDLGETQVLAGGSGLGYRDGPAADAQFRRPVGITRDRQGNLFVTDAGNSAIRKITPQGIVSTIAGGITVGNQDGPGQSAQFNSPEGIAIDSQGNLYVTDGCYGSLRKLSIQ
jgi:streptogramin lyase